MDRSHGIALPGAGLMSWGGYAKSRVLENDGTGADDLA
jgi:hypothetical protein